jgi:hypothetical protein
LGKKRAQNSTWQNHPLRGGPPEFDDELGLAGTANRYRLEPAAELLNLELMMFTVRNSGEITRALDGIAAADD